MARLGQAIRLVPRGRAEVKLVDHLRFSPHQLPAEELPEEMVVPVPLAVAVHRDDQEVPLLQALENPARPGAPDRRIAQGPAHPVEDGGAREKQHIRS